MGVHLILALAFCLISIIPAFKEYTKEWTPSIKSKYFWIYSWSGHALLLGSIAILLKLFELQISIIDLLAGTTMVISGLGLPFLLLVYRIESVLEFSFKSLAYSIHHLIMAFLGIWILFKTQATYFDVLLTIVILLFYVRLMIPKGLEVPWILYKKSSISLILRRRTITTIIVFLIILLPSLALLIF